MQLTPPGEPPSDPGRPLIPREILPAAVPPARPHRRPAATAAPSDPGRRQLSLFGVEAAEPSPADLAGLLAGPAHLVRMGGTARVSVRVDAAWRVHVLIAELSARGLEVTWAPVIADPATIPDVRGGDPDGGGSDPEAGDAEPGGEDSGQGGGTGTGGSPVPGVARFEVRTAYSSLLAGLARAWLLGTAKRIPERFLLTGPRLRLWAAASGARVPEGYVLGLDRTDGPDGWVTIDAALARAGLAGVVTDGPAYLISGRRRLDRLAELVGERPSSAPRESWPGVWHA